MSDSASQALPVDNFDRSSSQESSTSPSGNEEVRWEIVARAPGIAPATVIAGRLRADGIPVRVWQEGAGRAIGLTVGILGTGYVAVPSEYSRRAREILAEAEDNVNADDDALL